jgi:steroid delta-isomerase-like uncharacterized protein
VNKTLWAWLSSLSVYYLVGRVSLQGKEKRISAEENKAIARRFVEVLQEFFRTGDADLMDSVLADNVVQHISGMPPEAQSLEGFKQLLPALPQAFPDVLFEVENLVAEGDKVAFRLIWDATHQGEFFGIPPTGTRATVTEMHIFRIADGKVVERWGEWDALGLMQQLGAFPAPEQSEEANPT